MKQPYHQTTTDGIYQLINPAVYLLRLSIHSSPDCCLSLCDILSLLATLCLFFRVIPRAINLPATYLCLPCFHDNRPSGSSPFCSPACPSVCLPAHHFPLALFWASFCQPHSPHPLFSSQLNPSPSPLSPLPQSIHLIILIPCNKPSFKPSPPSLSLHLGLTVLIVTPMKRWHLVSEIFWDHKVFCGSLTVD